MEIDSLSCGTKTGLKLSTDHQAKYDLKESKNEPLVARLIELCKLECAIMREHDSELVADTDSGINHKVVLAPKPVSRYKENQGIGPRSLYLEARQLTA